MYQEAINSIFKLIETNDDLMGFFIRKAGSRKAVEVFYKNAVGNYPYKTFFLNENTAINILEWIENELK